MTKHSTLPKLAFSKAFKQSSLSWVQEAFKNQYMYHFTAFGRPVIQMPEDLVAIQELIWSVKPDLIIETGIAHGGSLIHTAGMLSILDLCEAAEKDQLLDPKNPKRLVLGIDVDIREHNRVAIQNHPLAHRIQTLEGSSVSDKIICEVSCIAEKFENIMVILDSNHTHEHVIKELEAYSQLVSLNSYCIVLDTFIEDLPQTLFNDRPWSPGNNPRTAVLEFLEAHKQFKQDLAFENKLAITSARGGFLKRIL